MSVRDIARHVHQTTGVEITHHGVAGDRHRAGGHAGVAAPAAGAFYPVLYVDALVAKVRDGSAVRNKALNIAVGIDTDGQARAGHLGRAGRGRQGMAQARAAAEPGPGGSAVRVLRRALRAGRGDHRDVAGTTVRRARWT